MFHPGLAPVSCVFIDVVGGADGLGWVLGAWVTAIVAGGRYRGRGAVVGGVVVVGGSVLVVVEVDVVVLSGTSSRSCVREALESWCRVRVIEGIVCAS